jgi:mRNA-degrading endonuclease RelE of RelBE toxin-antitoxin system
MHDITEQDIQKQVKDYLSVLGWYVIKNNTVGIYRQDTKRYIPSTSKGLADLTAIKNGRVIMIEIKRKGNRQSPAQKEFEGKWRLKGGTYWLIYNIDELIEKLNEPQKS